MNYNIHKYLKILELEKETNIDEQIIKKQYYKLARMVHPDRNPDKNANERFQNINEAYEKLMIYHHYIELEEDYEENTENNDFNKNWMLYMYDFLQSDLFFQIKSQLFHNIIEKLCNKCENKAYELIKQLDERLLQKFLCILHKNNENVPLSNEFIEKVEKLLHEKKNNKTLYILRPTLKNMFDDQVYKLKIGEDYIYVPLWHHELEYEINNETVIVQIIPELEPNIEINEKNDIIIYQKQCIKELWHRKDLEININNTKYTVLCENIKLTSFQEIRLTQDGISRISTQNIYDVSRKGDIIIYLFLYI